MIWKQLRSQRNSWRRRPHCRTPAACDAATAAASCGHLECASKMTCTFWRWAVCRPSSESTARSKSHWTHTSCLCNARQHKKPKSKPKNSQKIKHSGPGTLKSSWPTKPKHYSRRCIIHTRFSGSSSLFQLIFTRTAIIGTCNAQASIPILPKGIGLTFRARGLSQGANEVWMSHRTSQLNYSIHKLNITIYGAHLCGDYPHAVSADFQTKPIHEAKRTKKMYSNIVSHKNCTILLCTITSQYRALLLMIFGTKIHKLNCHHLRVWYSINNSLLILKHTLEVSPFHGIMPCKSTFTYFAKNFLYKSRLLKFWLPFFI